MSNSRVVHHLNVVDRLVEGANALRLQPGHEFGDFEGLFRQLTKADTTNLATLMVERAATIVNAEGDYVYLYSDGAVNVQVKMIGSDAPTTEICANEFDLVLMNISPYAVEVPVYRAAIDRADLTRRPPALVAGEPLSLAPHVPVVIPAYGDILDLPSVSVPAAVLVLHSVARAPVTWVFDRATGNPKHLTATTLQSSRVQLAARLLGAMGSRDDGAPLAALASSDEPSFVRWEAAEALYRLDPETGRALLRDRLIKDEDRAIREAAMATLTQVE